MTEHLENTIATAAPMSDREKQLAEKAGTRMLLIWLLGAIIAIQALLIAHLVK